MTKNKSIILSCERYLKRLSFIIAGGNTFAAWSKDRENLLHSSSGGIFLELAKKMLDNGGKVVGVVMDGTKARYVLSDDLEEIKQMRGSKYIPSNPSSVMEEVKNCKESVLFVGLPCHIEAVKKICNTNNILLCDLRCHGLPKKGIFEEHIKKISNGRDIISIKFRDKKAGWINGSESLIVEFSNGDTYDSFDQYMVDYMGGKILRDNCKTCEKSNVGDITLGDFWGVPPALENKLGTSIVTVNTSKGKEFFKSIDSITKKPVRFYHYLNVSSVRRIIFSSIKKAGLLPIIKKY